MTTTKAIQSLKTLQKAEHLKWTKDELVSLLNITIEEEAKNCVQSALQVKKDSLSRGNDNELYCPADCKLLLKNDGSIDFQKLGQTVFNRIVRQWRYDDNLLLASRLIKDFSEKTVANLISSMDLGHLKKAIPRRSTKIDFKKAISTGDEDKQEKNMGDEDKTQYTEDGKVSHVGKKVYFAKNKNQQILTGKVTGHGKHGITARDSKDRKHIIEHGLYTIHQEDEPDAGREDYGKESENDAIEKAFLMEKVLPFAISVLRQQNAIRLQR